MPKYDTFHGGNTARLLKIREQRGEQIEPGSLPIRSVE